MTIQELFNEYVSVSKDYQVSGVRQQQIIQEVEALVRKETIEEMLNDPRHSESDEWVVHTKLIEWVKGWALSKGVKLDQV